MPDSLPEGAESRILDAVTGRLRHPGRWRRGVAAVVVTVAVTAGPDGRLWFVEGASGASTIGAIRPPRN